MLKVILLGSAVIIAVVAIDRLLLWMESRGWIYYRRTKSRGGGGLYHALELHSIFDPAVKEVIEASYGEERKQDESGAPPAPESEEDEPPI